MSGQKTYAVLMMTLMLGGCMATTPTRAPAPLATDLDEGVLVANTGVVGTVSATKTDFAPSDCEENLGVGITVHSAVEDAKFLLDRHGNPCPEADVIFDGRQKVFQRAAPLGVDISFKDAFEAQLFPEEAGQELETPEIVLNMHHGALASPDQVAGIHAPETHLELVQSADQMPDDVAAAADAQLKGGQEALNNQLSSTIKGWRANEDRDRLLRETEKILSDVRTVKRVATLEQIRQQQERVLELTALLRDAERKAQLQQQQKEYLESIANKKVAMLETKRTVTDLENNKLRGQVETLQSRITDFERYNKRLKDSYENRQQSLQNQIAELSADLKETQGRSKAARQAAVLQAATQIAEAERLAFAAQVAQRQQLEMEAQRLQMEALKLSGKAQALPDKIPEKVGPEGLDRVYTSLISGRVRDADIERLANIVINGKATADSLGDAQFVVEAQDIPLKEIFALIIADVEDTAGAWRVSWQLRPKNGHIAVEKWSVTAESTVNDFISYVANQVYKTHYVKLAFKMFGKNRIVVITEDE